MEVSLASKALAAMFRASAAVCPQKVLVDHPGLEVRCVKTLEAAVAEAGVLKKHLVCGCLACSGVGQALLWRHWVV